MAGVRAPVLRYSDLGPERDAVIGTTFHRHPLPGGRRHWLFRANLGREGRFYRVATQELE